MFDRASGSLRCFQILKSLIELGYKVTFISKYERHFERYVPILQQLGVETYAGDVNALAKSNDLIILPEFDLEKIVRDNFYKTIIISFWDNAEYYLPLIRKYSPESNVIVDTVDIVYLRKIREAELKKDQYLIKEAYENKLREIEVYKNSDSLWVVTDKDGEVISEEVKNVPISIIPNIHPKIKNSKIFEETENLLFIGNFWHQPNVDAIDYFLNEIFPLVQKQLPEIKIYIVGDNVPKHLLSLTTDNVIFTGFVQETEPFLKMARISIAPLRYGAGMKGKVGEALSWGLPVVTTSIGAEGMNLNHYENVVIADNPQLFAKEIINIYDDKVLWNKISKNAKIKVEQNWSPERVEINLRKALAGMGNFVMSIIIVTYNALEYTIQCLESLDKSISPDCEIIIIDNASKDKTVEWLKKYAKKEKI